MEAQRASETHRMTRKVRMMMTRSGVDYNQKAYGVGGDGAVKRG